MPDQKFTRCPGCATVFRVTAAQLALREGQVRCGHCRAVFDANDHFVALDPLSGPDEFASQDELLGGRPTVTLRSADALQPVAATVKAAGDPSLDEDAGGGIAAVEENRAQRASGGDHAVERTLNEPSAEPVEATAAEGNADQGTTRKDATGEGPAEEGTSVEDATGERTAEEGTAGEGATAEGPADRGARDESLTTAAPASALPPIDLRDPEGPARFEWKKRGEPGTRRIRLYAAAIVVLVCGLALQAMLEYRDALAAHMPATRPLLAAACKPLGCTIGPLRDAAALSIDASDLQADPAHRGLLLLSATIRNRAGHAIAYPHLELTLTDSSDRVVVRRAFAPADYAGGTADLQLGIPANGERIVRIFLDASATQQAGYRLYLFYP